MIDANAAETIMKAIHNQTEGLVKAMIGPHTTAIVLVLEANDQDDAPPRVHCASAMPPDMTMGVIQALQYREDVSVPGEATVADLKAEDEDLSDVRPGEVGGVTG